MMLMMMPTLGTDRNRRPLCLQAREDESWYVSASDKQTMKRTVDLGQSLPNASRHLDAPSDRPGGLGRHPGPVADTYDLDTVRRVIR